MDIFEIKKTAIILGYALVCELYIFLFSMVMGSMAVFSILQLRRSELSLEELEKKVKKKNVIEGRMENMRKIGLITVTERGDELTFQGKVLASCFERLQMFFLCRILLDSEKSFPK